MGALDQLRSKSSEIHAIATKHGAGNVRVFGSVSRGEARPESDIDFLVYPSPLFSLLSHAGLTRELADLLGRKVDVVIARALRPSVRDSALREAVVL